MGVGGWVGDLPAACSQRFVEQAKFTSAEKYKNMSVWVRRGGGRKGKKNNNNKIKGHIVIKCQERPLRIFAKFTVYRRAQS